MAEKNLYNINDGMYGRWPGVYLDVNRIEEWQALYGPNAFPPGVLVDANVLRSTYNPLINSYKSGDGNTITAPAIAHIDTVTGAVTAGPAAEPEGFAARVGEQQDPLDGL